MPKKPRRSKDEKRPEVDDAQSKAWEEERAARLVPLRSESDEAIDTLNKCTELLAAEPGWVSEKEQRDTQLEGLLAKFPGLPKVSIQIAQLQRQYGSAEAERASAVRAVSLSKTSYESLVEQGAGALCECCGQGIPGPTLEQYFDAAERKVMTAKSALGTCEARLSNIASQLHDLKSGGSAEQQSVEQSIKECREEIVKCEQAIAVLAHIRASRDEAAGNRADADMKIAEVEREVNPFSGVAR